VDVPKFVQRVRTLFPKKLLERTKPLLILSCIVWSLHRSGRTVKAVVALVDFGNILDTFDVIYAVVDESRLRIGSNELSDAALVLGFIFYRLYLLF